ncbi:MAG TPA: peptidoglycan-binding protein [Pseudorhodoplanes sp.]|nr:peptidoglycan-binding protein [Pseudorhodoplanes sp.]
MRKTRTRKEPSFARAEEFDDAPDVAASGRKDLFAAAALVLGACVIAANALFLQKGPHPYPMFKPPRAAAAPASTSAIAAVPAGDPSAPVALPRPRPADIAPEQAGRSQTDIVIDIQKELAKRGFFDGVADGVYGAKTDTAIRDFEEAAGLKPGNGPTEGFLRVLSRSQVKAPPPETPRPGDQIAEMIAPSKRVIAVQRALADYGYGQLRPTGVLDKETQDTIEQFERSRKLPVTRQVTPRLVRELSAMTGRPLE